MIKLVQWCLIGQLSQCSLSGFLLVEKSNFDPTKSCNAFQFLCLGILIPICVYKGSSSLLLLYVGDFIVVSVLSLKEDCTLTCRWSISV